MAIALATQAIVLAIGVLKSFLLPYAMEIESFGYWQQYLLYAGFVGIFALGFNDGVYLLYGDKDYENLPFRRLRAAFRIYGVMLLIMSGIAAAVSLSIDDLGRSFAMAFVSVDIFIACVIGLFTYVLQVTNQFLWYSVCTLIDKAIFIVAAFILVMLGVSDFQYFIVLDVGCRVVSLILICWRCKEIVFGEASKLAVGIREFTSDVKVGVNLMLANFASMLVTNLGRFIVDMFGGIANFAYYSFGMSITNLVLTFVTAASSVLYPALKRVDPQILPRHFGSINFVVFVAGGAGLCLYFLAHECIAMFYQKYLPMLAYLNIMFVAAFFQAKMTLLVNTFYKTLRLERRLFVVNLQCVIGFAILATITFWWTHDVWWIAASTAITAGARCVWSEYELAHRLRLSILPSMTCQVILIVAFVVLTTAPMNLEGIGLVPGLVFAVFYGCLIFVHYGMRRKSRRQVR